MAPAAPLASSSSSAEAERALREEHAQLRRHLASTPLALVEWDGDYRVIGFSERAEALFGFAADEVIGKRIDEIPWVPEEDWPAVRAVMRDMWTGSRPSNVSANRNVRKDGSIIYCEWYNSAQHDASGRLLSVLSLVLDVTERKRLMDALADSESRHRSLFESMNEGNALHEMIYDESGHAIDYRFLEANEAFGRLTGLDPAAIIGRTVTEVIPGVEPAWIAAYARVVETGRPERFEAPAAPLGRWYEVSAYRPAPGRFAVSFADVTQRKRAEARAESLARFPEENPDPVLRLAPDLTVAYANPSAVDRLRALNLAVGAPAPAALAEPARRALREGEGTNTELECGGAVFSLSVSLIGAEVNVYGQDITARKRAEEALRASEERLRDAARRKDEFLAMLSHELRNPLAPIRNSIHVLDHAEPTGEQARRARAVILRQTEHLTRLVDDLLDVTRMARGKFDLHRERVDVADLVRRAGEDLRSTLAANGLELRVEAPDAPLWIDADPTRTAQVIGNLLHNAAKFTPAPGEVSLSVGRVGDRAEIRVRDTGVGIARELLGRVFEPFVQAEQPLARTQGGLGLGLAVVKGIVELHDGSVRAESDGPGSGAAFSVALPLAAASTPERGAGDGPAHAVDRRRVLVVDDNRDAAESLAALIEILGHGADVAYDGPAAVEMATGARYDVMLCDLGLPGMSGYEVARALRGRGVSVGRLVAVSGYAQPEDVARALAAGFDEHVAKPPDPERIARLLS